VTEEELEERRSRWRREDDALYREFLEFRAELAAGGEGQDSV
jgi:hypothetical protein